MRTRCTLILALAASGAQAGTIVSNGSFELGDIGAPGRVSIDNLEDWNASGGFSLLEQGVNGTSNTAAHTGNQFVSMGHNSVIGDTLTQTISTEIGTTYTVSFWTAVIQGSSAQSLVSAVRNVAGGELGSASIVANGGEGWVEHTYQFTASDTSLVLSFIHTGSSGSANIALDSVSIVPAPMSAALLGLGTLAATRRR